MVFETLVVDMFCAYKPLTVIACFISFYTIFKSSHVYSFLLNLRFPETAPEFISNYFRIASFLPIYVYTKELANIWQNTSFWNIDSYFDEVSRTPTILTMEVDILTLPIFNGLQLMFKYDELSLFFSIMTGVVMSILIIYTLQLQFKRKFLLTALLLWIEYGLLGVFVAYDLISFFIFFEVTLIPMFLLILFFGSGSNTKKAAFWFLIFTLISSIFLIMPITYLYMNYNITTFFDVKELFSWRDAKIKTISLFICSSFMMAFLIKLPLMPLHIWLPEVHVEAPTIGSMILASLLLKLGGYGLIRICLGFFTSSFYSIMFFLLPIIVLSLIASAAIATVHTDLKKVIAYSSISHMSVSLLGLILVNKAGYLGSVMSMFAHSFTAPILFFLVGCLYDRYHTRNVLYFGGLSRYMPIFTVIFFMYILSNISFPGFLNFIGEINIFFGIVGNLSLNYIFLVGITGGICLVTAYNLILYSRIFFGNLKNNIAFVYDITIIELVFALSFLVFLLFFGFYPESLLGAINIFTIII